MRFLGLLLVIHPYCHVNWFEFCTIPSGCFLIRCPGYWSMIDYEENKECLHMSWSYFGFNITNTQKEAEQSSLWYSSRYTDHFSFRIPSISLECNCFIPTTILHPASLLLEAAVKSSAPAWRDLPDHSHHPSSYHPLQLSNDQTHPWVI